MYQPGSSAHGGGGGGGSEGEQNRELEVELQTFNFFPHATSSFDPNDLAVDLRAIHPAWKRNLHELLEHPNASLAAFIIHVAITLLILVSAVVTVLETIPAFHSTSPSVWFGIETSLVVLFTVEYIARALAWSSSLKLFMGWSLSFFGIIDLLAIVPYYIELLIGVDTSVMFRFSILRTFRLLRVFRAFRSNNTITLTIEVMIISVKRSQHALLALGFFLLMFLVIFSTILYFAERGTWDSILETFIDADGEPSQFSSIPAAAWFVLVTITTVGYGEITPRSFLGRLLTVPLLVCGLLLIALPSFVLGREFSVVWDRMSGHTEVGGGDEPSAAALSRQIVDLQGALDSQGQMLRRLLAAAERTSGGHSTSNAFSTATSTSRNRNAADVLAAPRINLRSPKTPNGNAVLWDSDESVSTSGTPSVVSPNSRRVANEKGKGRASSGPGGAL
ncbi:voltage-gated potassium channel [Phellopilus nigrolimitatus]|nr:voltage-gated potassium channel [Phellopilus nigrolimitatus]